MKKMKKIIIIVLVLLGLQTQAQTFVSTTPAKPELAAIAAPYKQSKWTQ